MNPPQEPAPLGPTPRVSVVVPYYRAGAWVEETLRSVLAQTYPDLEVLVVDDGSPDADLLPPLLTRLAREGLGTPIRLCCQSNAGPSAARNHGIREARGSLVALLDADDRWAPALLKAAVEAFDGSAPPDMVCFDALVGWEGGGPPRPLMPPADAPAWLTLEDVIGGRRSITTTGAVIRREALLDVGGFDPDLRRAEDFDLWIRLALAGYRIRHLPVPLVLRRRLASGLASDAAAMRSAALEILGTHLRSGMLPRAAVHAAARFHRAIEGRQHLEEARGSLVQGHTGAARAALLKAMRLAPSAKGLAALAALVIAPGWFASWYGRRPSSAVGA